MSLLPPKLYSFPSAGIFRVVVELACFAAAAAFLDEFGCEGIVELAA